jgi:P4 family phage/plasmid primase-like protien
MIKISELELKKLLVQITPNNNKSNGKDLYIGITGWQKKTYEELEEINKKRSDDNKFNQYYIMLDRQYLVIDMDEEKAYNKLVNYLKRNNLYNEESITKSFKGKTKNIYFNRHFWFKIDNKKDYSHIKNEGQIKCDGGEIFFGNNGFIGEFKDTILNNVCALDIDNFNEIIDLLKEEKELKTKEMEKVHITFSDSEDEEEERPKMTKKKVNKPINNNTTFINSNDEIYKLVMGLSKERHNKYCYWVVVYFIFINEKLNLEIFEEFSKKSKKYNKEDNEKILKNVVPKKGYTLATLYFWLKEDNPELYKELCKTRKDFWNLKINNISMADFYYQICPDKYIYTYENGWYEYDDNNILIHRGDAPISLTCGMGRKLMEIATEQRNYITPDHEKYKEYMTFYNKFYEKAGTNQFIISTINQLKEPYYKDIFEYLNNVNLLAFNNVLYDFNLNVFRKIEKTDYITLTTGYDLKYKIINNKIVPIKDEQFMKKIKEFIYSLFENDELVNYWLNITGSSLFGNDKQQKFYIFTGKGSNGKSLTQKLLSSSLGKYYKSVSNNFLAGSIKKGGADAELAGCQGIRYLSISEPDDTENKKFNVSNLKNWSGGDKLQARGLYEKKMVEFYPLFTIFINCNDKPELSNTDDGIRRRVRVVNYPFQFKEQKDLNKNPKYRLINVNLSDIITNPLFIQNFILLLISHAEANKNLLIEAPKSILEESNKYVDENNPLYEWFNETLEQTNNEKDFIRASELYEIYNTSIQCKNKIRTNEFSKYMEKLGINKIFNSKKQPIYTNIKFVKIEEEDDDF